ncbi:hypothetical protein JW758_00580 [Candidatus Peregrinibacteria bacterium]|nr:hypothetical protein [Candidatus Peregrinibacteria bacterium]
MKKKLSKDRIIQIVLGAIIVILIGVAIASNNNGKENDLTFDLTPPTDEENTTDEGMIEVIDEETGTTITVPKTTISNNTNSAPETVSAPKGSASGGCFPSLSGKKDQKYNAIALYWTVCPNEDFQFYKLVKSSTNQYPAYPSDPVAMSSSNPDVANYLDKTITRATTYYYRMCVVQRLNKVTCGNSVSVSY